MEHRVGATMQSTGMRAARQRIVAREASTGAGTLGLITCPGPSFVAAVPDGLDRGLSRAIADAELVREKQGAHDDPPLPDLATLKSELLLSRRDRARVDPALFTVLPAGPESPDGDGAGDGDSDRDSDGSDNDGNDTGTDLYDANSDNPDSVDDPSSDDDDGSSGSDDENSNSNCGQRSRRERLPSGRADLIRICRESRLDSRGTPRALRARIRLAQANGAMRAFASSVVHGPVPPPVFSKKATKRALRRERLERGVEFCFEAVRAESDATGSTKLEEIRHFGRQVNALVHREFRERTGDRNRFMESEVSAVPDAACGGSDGRGIGVGNNAGSADEGDGSDDDEAAAARGVPGAVAPQGYEIDVISSDDPAALIGRFILFKWTGKPLRLGEFGWYFGEVAAVVTAVQRQRDVGVTHQVTHRNSETNNRLPFRTGYRRRAAELQYPLGLASDVRGADLNWVMLAARDAA